MLTRPCLWLSVVLGLFYTFLSRDNSYTIKFSLLSIQFSIYHIFTRCNCHH